MKDKHCHKYYCQYYLKDILVRGAWLAHSVEHVTLDLGHEFEPPVGSRVYLKEKETSWGKKLSRKPATPTWDNQLKHVVQNKNKQGLPDI